MTSPSRRRWAQLDETVQALESGKLPLADATGLYEKGMRLARICSEMLAAAELKVTQIQTAYGEQMRLPPDELTEPEDEKLIKADFHMHTHFSPDSETPPEKLVARCVEVGLSCIAVTDHNTIEGALEVERIAPFMVIVGEEVASSDGEITGLFLKEPVPKGLSPQETARRIKDQGGLVSLPHPFDRFRRAGPESKGPG